MKNLRLLARTSTFPQARRALLGLLVLLMLCATGGAQQPVQAPPATPSQVPADLSTYKIGPEDQISVLTRDIPEASGDFVVRTDGFITFPMIGDVKVEGLTTSEISALLVKRLVKELTNPVITVNIKALGARRIYVMGSVRTPGVLDWKPGWRLTEIISAAGGLAEPPERVKIFIIRGSERMQPISARDLLTGKGELGNVLVQPGDFLNVQSDVSVRVQVVGSVAKPGTTVVLEGQGVVEAVAAAGGPTPEARLTAAKVVRGGNELPINLYEAISHGDAKRNMVVLEGDTIYVPTLTDRVAVLGSVAKPGSMLVPDGKQLTLSEAVALAGGPVSLAKLDSVTLIHPKALPNTKPEHYNFSSIVKGGKNVKDPLLNDGDIVYIGQSGKTNKADIGTLFGAITFLRIFIP